MSSDAIYLGAVPVALATGPLIRCGRNVRHRSDGRVTRHGIVRWKFAIYWQGKPITWASEDLLRGDLDQASGLPLGFACSASARRSTLPNSRYCACELNSANNVDVDRIRAVANPEWSNQTQPGTVATECSLYRSIPMWRLTFDWLEPTEVLRLHSKESAKRFRWRFRKMGFWNWKILVI